MKSIIILTSGHKVITERNADASMDKTTLSLESAILEKDDIEVPITNVLVTLSQIVIAYTQEDDIRLFPPAMG